MFGRPCRTCCVPFEYSFQRPKVGRGTSGEHFFVASSEAQFAHISPLDCRDERANLRTFQRARPDSNGGPAGSKPVRGGGVIAVWILGNPWSPAHLLEIATSPSFD